ncbi:MAG: flagellar hook-length control protein FliK [Beijerinckiaceae bacterium]|nr:flagellar hook-length control protein FliK [Beijerinckiaceae bacterium]
MVETTAVQAVAVQRSPGDSLAMDRSSSSSSMGLVFDLISLAAKPSAGVADASAQPAAPTPMASGDMAALAHPDASVDSVSITSPSDASKLATIGDGPISVDALVAMDKTARQGLTAKPFIEKPAVEWMISVLSAAGLVKNAPNGSENLTQTADAPMAQPNGEAPSSQITQTGSALTDPSQGIAEGPIALSKAPIDLMPSHTLMPEVPSVSQPEATTVASAIATEEARQETATSNTAPTMALSVEPLEGPGKSSIVPAASGHGMELSNTAPAIPVEPSQMAAAPAMAGMTPLPPAPVSALVDAALPAPTESHPLTLEGNATQPQAAAPLAPAIAQSVTTPPNLSGMPVELAGSSHLHRRSDQDAKGDIARPVAEQPQLESPKPAMPVDAVDGTATPSVVDVIGIAQPAQGVLAAPASPLAPHDDETAASKADVSSPAPFMAAKKPDHSAKTKPTEKAAVSTDAVSTASTPVLPLTAMTQETKVTPAAAEHVEMSEQEGLHPLGRRPKPVALPADCALTDDHAATTAKSPVAPSMPSFDPRIGEKAQASAPPLLEPLAEKPGDLAQHPAPIASAPHLTTDDEAHLLHQAMPQKPIFEGNGPIETHQPSSATPLADQAGLGGDFQNSSSNQQNLAQNFDQSNGSAASSHALPDHVTVETVSIGSQHSTHEDAPSSATLNATTADQTAPLSVFTDAEPTKIGGSEFLSRPSTFSANGSPSAANTSPAAASPIRVDNPIFIAQRDKALQQQIISALRSGHDEIRLSLYPPQLGQVTINMALDVQKVKVGVKTANREATNLLVGERQSLAQALGHEGFTLEGFDVTDDAPKERTPEHEVTERLIPNSQMAAESSFSLDITI